MTRTVLVGIFGASLMILTACESMTGKTTGQTIDDATMTASIQGKLTADKLSNFSRINVDTDRSIVTLNGVVRLGFEEVRQIGNIEGHQVRVAVGSGGADVLPAGRRARRDVQRHLRRAGEVAAGERDFDRFAALAAEGENQVHVRQGTGVETIGKIPSALVAKVAELHQVLAVLRHGEREQTVEAIVVLV